MVDTRGYICPTPVLMVQKALKDGPASLEGPVRCPGGGGEHHPLCPVSGLSDLRGPGGPGTTRLTLTK